MGDVRCRRCGERWDFYYVTHEMDEEDRTAFLKGICCPKCRQKLTPDEVKKEKALSSIIGVLNEIEEQVLQLERSVGQLGNGAIGTFRQADAIANQFFVSCQIAEERIKYAYREGCLTKVQLAALNKQLAEFVRDMVKLSEHSELLREAIRRIREHGVTI